MKKCKWGHVMTEVYINPKGRKVCRPCMRESRQYNYYREKCREAKVESVVDWNGWATDKFGKAK